MDLFISLRVGLKSVIFIKGHSIAAKANLYASRRRQEGKTQFVLFGRMQFVLKVCSMREVIVCSTGFSLFYQKTVG